MEERVGDKQFSSLGLVMHSQGGGLVICGGKDKEKVGESPKFFILAYN